jgi:hypothetical protein
MHTWSIFLNSKYTNFSIQRFQVFGGYDSIFGDPNCLKYNIMQYVEDVLCDTILTCFLLGVKIIDALLVHDKMLYYRFVSFIGASNRFV